MQAGTASNHWPESQGRTGQTADTSAADSGLAPMPSIPMYLAGLVVTYSGLHAANISLGDPSFAALILGLTLIGFAASYITRRQNIAPRNVELPALVVCVCVVLMAVITDPADSFLAPASVAEDRSKALALLLTWLTVFRSFTLTSDAALLFCCVPTIALIGLVGTATADPQLPTVFMIFVAAAIFMMVHENVRQTATLHLDRRTGRTAGRSAASWGGQVQVTAVCTVLAITMANFISPFVQAAGSAVRVSSGLSNLRMAQERVSSARGVNEERTELQVGTGPVSLSDEIVFTVQSQEAVNWRGPTFDRYTGHGWQNIFSSTATPIPEAQGVSRDYRNPDRRTYSVQPSEITPPAKQFHVVNQHVRFVQGSTTAIYGAGEVRQISISERRVLADEGGAIRLADPLTNAEYDVRSEIADMSPAARRAPPGDYPRRIFERYTKLTGVPADVVNRIRRQATEVTQGKEAVYDKVTALTAWIDQQCKYNTNTTAYPPDRDVVDYFLFDVKEGYCDSFATSLAILCRTVGIPARVVSGYLSGDLDSGQNQFIVRDRHKHLWTEVFFNGVGWVGFDATSGAADVSPTRITQKSKSTTFWAALFSHGWWPPALLGVVILLLAYVVKVEIIDRLVRRRHGLDYLGIPETNAEIVHAYVEAEAALARRGVRRISTQTATEYLDRASEALLAYPEVEVPLAELTGLLNRYRYGKAVAASADVARAQQCAVAIRQSLRSARRSRLAFDSPTPETA